MSLARPSDLLQSVCLPAATKQPAADALSAIALCLRASCSSPAINFRKIISTKHVCIYVHSKTCVRITCEPFRLDLQVCRSPGSTYNLSAETFRALLTAKLYPDLYSPQGTRKMQRCILVFLSMKIPTKLDTKS